MLKDAGCPSVVVGREVIPNTRRNTLQIAVDSLSKQSDLILFVLPEQYSHEAEDEEQQKARLM